MAKPLTTTSHALLGLLSLKSWTTYELAKQVQRSLGWFWPRAERKLYEEPKQLVAAGLATATEERTGSRPRTVYTITPAGKKALKAWLDQPSSPSTMEFEAMVKVFFADGGTLKQLRATLDDIEAEAQGRLTALEAMIAAGKEGEADFPDRLALNAIALRFHLDYETMRARWAIWAREQIASWQSPTDAGRWDWEAALARTV
jgi:DNA-binding PadR family transcriptional regulator